MGELIRITGVEFNRATGENHNEVIGVAPNRDVQVEAGRITGVENKAPAEETVNNKRLEMT